MFTGLIEGTGRIQATAEKGGDRILSIIPRFDMPDSRTGDSISVNGLCLTITGLQGSSFTVYASRETVSRSTLDTWTPGDMVNLERALRFSDRLDGHIVSGHVDGVGKVLQKQKKGASWLLRIGTDESLARYIVEKGSIAVDGISLTINRCQELFFEVNIIPETMKTTNIDERRAGDRVNIETDLIAKYIEKFISRERVPGRDGDTSTIDREMLEKYGFGD
ncbi:MAG TPA: riboflavin synthase [Desulfobacteraceae bacterium]|nr:riboflavin synthase [Desulfobacteraceae bacterium]